MSSVSSGIYNQRGKIRAILLSSTRWSNRNELNYKGTTLAAVFSVRTSWFCQIRKNEADFELVYRTVQHFLKVLALCRQQVKPMREHRARRRAWEPRPFHGDVKETALLRNSQNSSPRVSSSGTAAAKLSKFTMRKYFLIMYNMMISILNQIILICPITVNELCLLVSQPATYSLQWFRSVEFSTAH